MMNSITSIFKEKGVLFFDTGGKIGMELLVAKEYWDLYYVKFDLFSLLSLHLCTICVLGIFRLILHQFFRYASHFVALRYMAEERFSLSMVMVSSFARALL